MDLAGPIIEMLNCLMPPVCGHLEHHRNLQQNMEEMRRRLGDLNSLKEDIESRKQTAEASSTKAVRSEVERWLVNVQTINNEIQIVEQKFQNVSCLCRGSLGKRVQKKIGEVNRLLQVGCFPEDIVIDKPPSSGMTLPVEDAKGRSDLKKQIREYLMGNDVGIIGVWGPGGIGKTTTMKNIHNDLLNESKFHKVIWAIVPYPVSVAKLQDNIASNMKQTLPENVTEEQRAATLSEILSRVRFVLILDDAWGRFTFEDVGIPKPTQQNGCKVVITSRLIELCNHIRCEQVIRMQQLSKEESLNLFLDTVGHDVMKIPNLEETSKLVVEECGGLPLAVVMARSMRGENDISMWRYALFELRNRVKRVKDWDDEIFERLKFSYDRLNDPELQNCFLHCSLYPKDGSIRRYEVIQGWIDNGLIEHLETRKAMHDRANFILNSLINKCLIERVEHYSDFGIRMHDVMREMALQVAGPRFMAKAGLQVTKAPEANEWMENLEKVWLRSNRITDFASSMSPNCPKLSGLDLSWNYDLRQIPDSFFARMIGLKFLTLSGTAIEAVPDSISILENLTVLRLAYCRKLRHMPSLVNLKALKKLDLKQAGILEVPQGMEMLVNLQHLDLYCPDLVELPMEILSNLTHLQFLAVALKPTSFVTKAEKVIKLKVLETFIGQFDDLQVLNNFVKSFHEDQKFTRYWLSVGLTNGTGTAFDGKMRLDGFEMGRDYYELLAGVECTKIIALSGVEIGRDYSLLLLNDVQLLKITKCSDVKILSETSLFNTAADLRYCEIDGCKGLKCMLDLFSWSSVRSSFDKLEILWLNNLCNLQVLVKVEAQAVSAPSTSRAPRPAPSSIFSNLKIFTIRNCPRIKKLFPFELLKGLQNLEEIDVADCQRVEEIIQAGDEKETNTAVGNSETIRLGLPKLRKLRLKVLPKLKSICTTRGVMVCDSLQSIEIYDCRMLNRIPLYLQLLPNGELSLPSSLQEICIDSKEWWESLLWDNPSAMDVFLPLLKPRVDHSLHKGFDDLKDFNNFVKSFQGQKLTSYELSVEAIDDDDYDDDSSNAVSDSDFEIDDDDFSKGLTLSGIEINEDYPVLPPVDLQVLVVAKCCGLESLNDAFVFKALSDLSSCPPCPPTQPSIFSNLEYLLINKCPRIKKLFTSELLKGLQNLKRIYVIGCATMEEIIEVEEEKETLMTDGENEPITFILPKLTKLLLVGLPDLKSICTARGVMVCDSLEIIGIVKCPSLKRIPLYLPLLSDGELCPPPSLRRIYTKSRECWESLVWDNPSTKDILLPFLKIKEELTDASETEDESISTINLLLRKRVQ